MERLKINGDNEHPCFVPRLIAKRSEMAPPIQTLADGFA